MTTDLTEKYVKFVSKLIEMTQAGALRWKAGSEDMYFSAVNGRSLTVSRTFTEAPSNTVMLLSGGPRFSTKYHLEIGKSDNADPYTITNRYGVENLFTAAVLASTKIEDFMDALLDD